MAKEITVAEPGKVKLTGAEHRQLDAAMSMSCEVLLRAVKYQAENNMLSEDHCLRMAAAYNEAAEVARTRRLSGAHKTSNIDSYATMQG